MALLVLLGSHTGAEIAVYCCSRCIIQQLGGYSVGVEFSGSSTCAAVTGRYQYSLILVVLFVYHSTAICFAAFLCHTHLSVVPFQLYRKKNI